jgi:hypothetical protein
MKLIGCVTNKVDYIPLVSRGATLLSSLHYRTGMVKDPITEHPMLSYGPFRIRVVFFLRHSVIGSFTIHGDWVMEPIIKSVKSFAIIIDLLLPVCIHLFRRSVQFP